MDLTSSTSLITGASSGMGEQFAMALADRGSNLVLVARRGDRLSHVRDRLLATHPRLTVELIVQDLSLPQAGASLAREVDKLGCVIDLLINNAGAGLHSRFVDQVPAPLADLIQLNCGTLVDLTARYLPAMVARGTGVVINVASTAAFQPTPGMAVYGASKAFVLSFTEALWQECSSQGVRILALCPGATETEFFEHAGANFAVNGRQSARQVVDIALAELDKSAPTVICGRKNALLVTVLRHIPKKILLPMVQRILRPVE
jgi:short-subunit dehydrogenase